MCHINFSSNIHQKKTILLAVSYHFEFTSNSNTVCPEMWLEYFVLWIPPGSGHPNGDLLLLSSGGRDISCQIVVF
jgi:hypothetical protein